MPPFAGRRDDIPERRPETARQHVVDNRVDSRAQVEEDTCGAEMTRPGDAE